MLISFFRTSGRLLVFGSGLLLGIQVPAFVDQYSQRVDAHYREVSANIAGFQRTADELFAGDLGELVEYYRSSNDPVFERDAESVQTIVERYARLSAEYQAMQANLVAVAMHVLFTADTELLAETRNQYSYTVPLNGIALQWGLAAAVVLFLLAELSVGCCVGCVRLIKNRKLRQGHTH